MPANVDAVHARVRSRAGRGEVVAEPGDGEHPATGDGRAVGAGAGTRIASGTIVGRRSHSVVETRR